MTAARNLAQSDEAFWEGAERCWASIQQYPPRKGRSSWILVLIGLALVAVALGGWR